MEPDNNMTSAPESSNQAPMTAPQQTPVNGVGHEENAWGPMIGVVVIVLLLVAGGFYYYMQESGMDSTEDETTMTPEEQAAQDTAELQSVADQSTSSAFSAIEADFNATDASSLDDTLNSIDSELSI